MKKLVENHTSEELREALQKRIEFEQAEKTEKGEKFRQDMLAFLTGKRFLMEKHPNPNSLDLYEVDIKYNPHIIENKWVRIRTISRIRVFLSVPTEEEHRVSDELRVESRLDLSTFDDFTPYRGREEDKYKAFHHDDLLQEIDEKFIEVCKMPSD